MTKIKFGIPKQKSERDGSLIMNSVECIKITLSKLNVYFYLNI